MPEDRDFVVSDLHEWAHTLHDSGDEAGAKQAQELSDFIRDSPAVDDDHAWSMDKAARQGDWDHVKEIIRDVAESHQTGPIDHDHGPQHFQGTEPFSEFLRIVRRSGVLESAKQTMVLADYSSQRYHALMGIKDATYAHTHTSFETLRSLGDTICRHGLEKNVGVCLLHKHFAVDQSEHLVRHYSNRECRIKPEAASAKNIPCVWGMTVRGEDQLVPIEFTNAGCSPEAVDELRLVEGQKTFVEGFGRIIKQRSAENLYGFATLHGMRHIDPAPDETMMEGSVAERELKVECMPLALLSGVETAQTLWVFSSKQLETPLACPLFDPNDVVARHCWGHCVAHCPVRCR